MKRLITTSEIERAVEMRKLQIKHCRAEQLEVAARLRRVSKYLEMDLLDDQPCETDSDRHLSDLEANVKQIRELFRTNKMHLSALNDLQTIELEEEVK